MRDNSYTIKLTVEDRYGLSRSETVHLRGEIEDLLSQFQTLTKQAVDQMETQLEHERY